MTLPEIKRKSLLDFAMKTGLTLNLATGVIFVLLALETCFALPIEIFCLATGIVVLGSLAFLAATELRVVISLENSGFSASATVMDIRKNRVGWQRVRIETRLPDGSLLRKWADDAFRNHNVGDIVAVSISKEHCHCRIKSPPSSCWQAGPSIAILCLTTIVATGKTLFLCFYLATQQKCNDTCGSFRCEDEFGIRLFYALLAGATVYTDLCVFVTERYYQNFPSMTEYQLVRVNSHTTIHQLSSDELDHDEKMTLVTTASTESADTV